MKPYEDIKQYFKKATLSTNPGKHEAIFEKILNAQKQVSEREPESNRINLGRIIMKSPITKLATAAVIVIACITGLTMFKKTSSIAIADVLRNMEEINAYKYQYKIHSIDQLGNDHYDFIIQSEILKSKDYGKKINTSILDTNDKENIRKSEVYFFLNKPYFTIDHFSKSYRQIELEETLLKPGIDEYTDPYELVESFLKNGYKNLGISIFDGKEVEVFQINEKADTDGSGTKSETVLYVDIKTQLPVKIESNVHTEGHDSTDLISDVQYIRDGFQWNVSVTAADFEPNIPDGYTNTVTTGIGGRGGMMGGAQGQ